MNETQDEIAQFWAVGSSSASKRDHAKFFIENNIWEDGSGKKGDPINKPVLDMIKKGDYLLLQSTSKGKGTNKTIAKLKAVGKVTGRIKDNYYTFFVAWDTRDPGQFPKEFNGIAYDKAIESMKVDEMLRYARKILGLTFVSVP
jgi:hypothetical protein